MSISHLRHPAIAALIAVSFVATGSFRPGVVRADAQNDSATKNSEPLQEVTVTARKLDQRRLDHVIIPRFVQSHGTPNPKTHQVGRWTRPGAICPRTVGLKPAYADFVSRRIVAIATRVGAPISAIQQCKATVEVIFTPDPQAQLDYFGKTWRAVLGYTSGPSKDLVTFNHHIRAWYATATKSQRTGWTLDSDQPLGNIQDPGSASRLSVGLTSGFVNVLVIADSNQVAAHSLNSVADYIAMLALSRTALDGCSELPSIVDLLSVDCHDRAAPDSITAADIAYLRALYSADLEKNLNLEQGGMHDLMLQDVLGKK